MTTFNYAKLRGKIREVFGTQANFAEAMGMGMTTVSARLNGQSGDWSRDEMARAAHCLGFSVMEIPLYFYCEDGLETRTRTQTEKEECE